MDKSKSVLSSMFTLVLISMIVIMFIGAITNFYNYHNGYIKPFRTESGKVCVVKYEMFSSLMDCYEAKDNG